MCCIFAEHIFKEKLCQTAFEDNSFVLVNCKFCLHKLKWTNLVLQTFLSLFVGLQVTKIWSVNCNSWSAKCATYSFHKIRWWSANNLFYVHIFNSTIKTIPTCEHLFLGIIWDNFNVCSLGHYFCHKASKKIKII